MPIFSRRVLQKIINENSEFLSREQTAKHVKDLNRAGDKSLATEWEIVLLNAFSKLGTVNYEADFGGSRKPDIHFLMNKNQHQSFVADVTVVSDQGYKKENPIYEFQYEIVRLFQKCELSPNGFSLDVGAHDVHFHNSSKEILKLPKKGKFNVVLNNNFIEFLRIIKSDKTKTQKYEYRKDNIDVTILYNPQGQHFISHYLNYTTTYSLDSNPIYNRLRDKKDQLKNTGYSGPKAIFLCDGDCNLIKDNGRKGFSYGLDEVINYFLQKSTSISFIVVFDIELLQGGEKYVRYRVYRNPQLHKQLDQDMLQRLDDGFKHALQVPVFDVSTAISYANSILKNEGKHEGHMTIDTKERKIRISSRHLLELLAGKITQNNFFTEYRQTPTEFHPDDKNIFELWLKKGRLIKSISLIKSPELDDDSIIIEFGDSDPAVSSIKDPNK